MLIITFPQSKSKNYSIAQDYLKEFDNHSLASGVNPNQVTIDDKDIFPNLPKLLKLISVIQKFSGLKLLFNGVEYNCYQFIRDQQFIKECSDKFTNHKSHCCNDDIYEGWGCRFIKSMFRHLKGNHFYKDKKYWYNYGYFTDESTWRVDKETIDKIIVRECKEKNLVSCPFFKMERVKKYINSLPAEIDLNGPHWERFYKKDVLPNGSIDDIAINIRHVSGGEHFSTDGKIYVSPGIELPYDLRRRNRNLPLS